MYTHTHTCTHDHDDDDGKTTCIWYGTRISEIDYFSECLRTDIGCCCCCSIRKSNISRQNPVRTYPKTK